MKHLVAIVAILSCILSHAHARDNGQYAGGRFKSWYESQHNAQGGYCCNEADGQDFYGDYQLTPDGGVEFDDGGKHYKLPPYMVLTGPNPTGHAVWWHIGDASFCFAPGGGT